MTFASKPGGALRGCGCESIGETKRTFFERRDPGDGMLLRWRGEEAVGLSFGETRTNSCKEAFLDILRSETRCEVRKEK
jgi:hypothetical protein